MRRRHFLARAAAIPALALDGFRSWARAAPDADPGQAIRRVRPGDPSWPSAANWDRLSRKVGGRLIKVQSPLEACRAAPDGGACNEVFRTLRNPYHIGDHPALTQTSGWVDGWTAAPSAYAVAAEETGDVVAAVNFAREQNLRLVVKGGGHSYQGTSNAPDSLLVWTRAMNRITLSDAFVAKARSGCRSMKR